MLTTLSKPVVFAHRGASSHAPENTLASFKLAVEQGASAVELDVQLSADQEVMVFHDLTLERTTNGEGRISDFRLSELKRLNAGVKFDPAYQEVKIPTLSEVLDALPSRIFINIELKNLASPLDTLPERTSEIIRDYQAQDRVLISSFNPTALKKFLSISPGIPCGRLLHNRLIIKLYKYLPSLSAYFQSIHLPYSSLSEQKIQIFHKRGLMVFAYTLNHPRDIIKAVNLGVDGFFTDDPAFAQRLLSRGNSTQSEITITNEEH